MTDPPGATRSHALALAPLDRGRRAGRDDRLARMALGEEPRAAARHPCRSAAAGRASCPPLGDAMPLAGRRGGRLSRRSSACSVLTLAVSPLSAPLRLCSPSPPGRWRRRPGGPEARRRSSPRLRAAPSSRCPGRRPRCARGSPRWRPCPAGCRRPRLGGIRAASLVVAGARHPGSAFSWAASCRPHGRSAACC